MIPLPAVLGINLWLVALVVPCILSYGSAGGSFPGRGMAAGMPAWVAVTLPLAPFVLLCFARRSQAGHRLAAPALLCAVPLLCLVPGQGGTLLEAGRSPRLSVAVQAAVLLLYLLSACRELGAGPAGVLPGPGELTALPSAPVPLRWRRRMFLYRALVALSIALPAVLLYAIDLHPANLRAFRLSFAGQGDPAGALSGRVSAVQAAATAAAALLWVVAFWWCFALPLSGHLLHDREVNQRVLALRQDARRGRPRTQFYLAMALALFSMVLLIWRSLHSP